MEDTWDFDPEHIDDMILEKALEDVNMKDTVQLDRTQYPLDAEFSLDPFEGFTMQPIRAPSPKDNNLPTNGTQTLTVTQKDEPNIYLEINRKTTLADVERMMQQRDPNNSQWSFLRYSFRRTNYTLPKTKLAKNTRQVHANKKQIVVLDNGMEVYLHTLTASSVRKQLGLRPSDQVTIFQGTTLVSSIVNVTLPLTEPLRVDVQYQYRVHAEPFEQYDNLALFQQSRSAFRHHDTMYGHSKKEIETYLIQTYKDIQMTWQDRVCKVAFLPSSVRVLFIPFTKQDASEIPFQVVRVPIRSDSRTIVQQWYDQLKQKKRLTLQLVGDPTVYQFPDQYYGVYGLPAITPRQTICVVYHVDNAPSTSGAATTYTLDTLDAYYFHVATRVVNVYCVPHDKDTMAAVAPLQVKFTMAPTTQVSKLIEALETRFQQPVTIHGLHPDRTIQSIHSPVFETMTVVYSFSR